MKNVTTPRTLADCSFQTGYPTIEPPEPRTRFSPRFWFFAVLSLALWSAFVWVVTS